MATQTSKPSQVGNNFYKTSVTTNTDGSLKATTFRTDAKGNNPTPVFSRTTTPNGQGGFTSKDTIESGATAAEKTAFSNPKSTERTAYSQQVQSLNPTNSTAQQKAAQNAAAGNGNNATNSAGGDSPGGDEQKPASTAEEQAAVVKGSADESRTRTNYETLVIYPSNLRVKNQDCIKFTMLKYSPSELKSQGGAGSKSRVVTVTGGTPGITGRTALTTIVLPVPGGITDSNQVEWTADSMSDIQQSFTKIAAEAIQAGPDAGIDAAKQELAGTVGKDGGKAAEDVLTSKFSQAATNAANVQQRKFGSIINPNLELLFTGPSLRSFTFTFRLSPRNQDDAKNILKIIRYFKQGMSVKRDTSSLILRSPHTFAISYISEDTQHRYLNRFKECALQNCSVNYTPDGNYMTFYTPENSMTSYELTLTFQELEPVFDDEYGQDNTTLGF